MDTQAYAVGSIADLISGQNTPDKPKVVQKSFKEVTFQTPVQTQKVLKPQEKKPKNKKQKQLDVSYENKELNAIKNNEQENLGEQNVKIRRQLKRKRDSADLVDKDGDVQKKKVHTDSSGGNRLERAANRTLFVGNVPLKLSKLYLQKFFSKYGDVETVRIRGIPVADVRVPKKVAYIKKKFHPERTSACCYVR